MHWKGILISSGPKSNNKNDEASPRDSTTTNPRSSNVHDSIEELNPSSSSSSSSDSESEDSEKSGIFKWFSSKDSDSSDDEEEEVKTRKGNYYMIIIVLNDFMFMKAFIFSILAKENKDRKA